MPLNRERQILPELRPATSRQKEVSPVTVDTVILGFANIMAQVEQITPETLPSFVRACKYFLRMLIDFRYKLGVKTVEELLPYYRQLEHCVSQSDLLRLTTESAPATSEDVVLATIKLVAKVIKSVEHALSFMPTDRVCHVSESRYIWIGKKMVQLSPLQNVLFGLLYAQPNSRIFIYDLAVDTKSDGSDQLGRAFRGLKKLLEPYADQVSVERISPVEFMLVINEPTPAARL